ncbi:MAG TPA: ribonuclease Y, partial [Candidatus Polarisedimenticolaceae bacterium]|nr:ribonuclease Y [Candidatus Polarisedimenticolaceae bacterium]
MDGTGPLVLAALASVIAGGVAGWLLNNRFGAKSLEAMRKRTDEALRAARREAEKSRRKLLLEAREQILQQRNKTERDLRSRRGQLNRRERDLQAGLKNLEDQQAEGARERERLTETARKIEAELDEASRAREESAKLIELQTARLSELAEMTRDEAQRQLLANLKAETRLEAANLIKEIKDEAQRNADAEATKITALAIERMASDLSAERTVSLFELPAGTELMGRIIGQEGKNIKAFELATGIQLVLDEAARTVTLSGYHPVKREIARRVLETLVSDGNIHPRRIEELTRRNRRRLEEEMKRAGGETLKELNIKGVHPELAKLLGRLKFRSSYAQNVLMHSKEVAYLTGMLAAELRLDEGLARRAGLLHDIGKAIDYEREGTHPEIGAEVASKFGEPEVVVNAIASHHEDCEMTSPISVLVSAADSLSGARPGARRKTVAEYIKRIDKLEELANSMRGVEQSYAIQAGREIRVIARSREVDDAQADLLATDLAARIQSEMDY